MILKKLFHFSGMLQLLMMKLFFIQMNRILVLMNMEKQLIFDLNKIYMVLNNNNN